MDGTVFLSKFSLTILVKDVEVLFNSTC